MEDESAVRAFMRGPDESDVCLPQADKVEAFCYGANLESLQAAGADQPAIKPGQAFRNSLPSARRRRFIRSLFHYGLSSNAAAPIARLT